MRTRRLSPRTEDAYIHWIADFFAWTGWAKPDALTSEQVTDYLSHLAVDRKVAGSTQNQAFNALLFLFRYGLEREFGEINAVRANGHAHVPEFLTEDEVRSLCKFINGADWLLLTQLGYGTGLRLMELLRLRVKDIDFANGLIVVHDGTPAHGLGSIPLATVIADQREKADAIAVAYLGDNTFPNLNTNANR